MPIVVKAEDLNTEYIVQHSSSKFFDDYTPQILPSRKFETIKVSSDLVTLKLIDKNQKDLLSIVHGDFKTYNNIDYYEIIGTYSKIQRSGFLTYLFEVLVYEYNYKILSDSHHSSPGSKEFWQAHIRRNKFSIYRLDIETNFKRNANRFKENEIWGEIGYHSFGTLVNDNSSLFDENVEDIDDEFDEGEDILDIDELSAEQLDGDIISESSSIDKIRLVAQKYVG
jgi:hypothetical protein